MKAPRPPESGKSVPIPAAPGNGPAPVAGGETAEVRDVVLTGNTAFTDAELRSLVSDQLGKRMDLAGMKDLARRIGDHYRERGYPFARAIVPVQEFRDGVLKISVLEGRYGKIGATGEPYVVTGVGPFLANLSPGDLLEAGRLERAMLIIDDIPGLNVTPSVSPGTEVGTSDLAAAVAMEVIQAGSVGVDNAGSRYTGYHRAYVSWNRNGLGTFGDKLALMLMSTDLSMVLGSADYELPLGGSGLRLQAGYANTTYQLGREYEDLGASGLAKVWSSRMSYPLVRSQKANLSLSVGIQHKDLQDDFRAVSRREAKSTTSLPVTLRFDRRDNFMSGAVTYGMLGATWGKLSLDDSLAATDEVTARKAGSYGKLTFDLARIQSLGGGWALFSRVSGQTSTKNLDSSERIGLGGAEGVRAYPLGEGTGDVGYFGQVEVRYEAAALKPYLLYDFGYNRVNHSPWDAGSDQDRNLSGAGLGLRYDQGAWSGNLSMAYRIDGGSPTQDLGPSNYRLYFSLSRSF